MVEIFDSLKLKLPPLQEYLDYMFEGREGCLVDSRRDVDKVLPRDILRCELFYPTRRDIVQTLPASIELASEAAQVFRREFRDEKRQHINTCQK